MHLYFVQQQPSIKKGEKMSFVEGINAIMYLMIHGQYLVTSTYFKPIYCSPKYQPT